MPDQKKERFIKEHNLSSYEANILVSEKEISDYYEEVIKGCDKKLATNWITVELFAVLNKKNLSITQSPISPKNLSSLIKMITSGKISGKIAKDVFEKMQSSDKDPKQSPDRIWCNDVTDLLHVELNRISHAQETWEDRELVWRARRMIHTIRSGDEVSKSSFHEAVLGSRRVRAAWQYLSKNDTERTDRLEARFKSHHHEMEKIQLRSWELKNRQKKTSFNAFTKNILFWVWSASWMLGLVTWSAMIATGIPYLIVRLLVNKKARNEEHKAGVGSFKLLYSIGLYPIWWLFTALTLGWLIASTSSPIQDISLPGMILPMLATIPWMLVSFVLLLWWPISARLHLKLYGRLCKSWRNLRLWFRLRSGQVQWETLISSHNILAQEMASIGDGLVLPGDSDWIDPPSGKDDWEMVKLRSSD